MLRSLMAKMKHLVALAAQSVSAAINGASIDREGAGSLMFILNVGSFLFTGVNFLTVRVEHSDDGASWSNIGEGDLFEAEDMANGIYKLLDENADASKLYEIHYLGNKRYVRLAMDEDGAVDCPMSANAIMAHLEAMPSA